MAERGIEKGGSNPGQTGGPIGAVLVVGAGVTGVQAAEDLANSGYYVYLLEKTDKVGGVTAELDKMFPTHDCFLCMVCPKQDTHGFVEVTRHPFIEFLPQADLQTLEGEPGNFKAQVKVGLQSEARTLEVGAVILAPGFEVFDPTINDVYHYADHPNVINSLEFERLLSGTGPTGGRLLRPSDGQEAKKIAWFQCVGSRDIHHGDNAYCSSICCMYALKEAMMAKELCPEPPETSIFFMDIRTFGKDFELYLNRAQNLGVRLIRSRIHSIDPIANNNISLKYIDETGESQVEDYDLVVLSVGMQITKETQDLAKKLGIELNEHNFAKTTTFQPVKTNRPGIYVCGAFQNPLNIPESVTQAAAAVAAVSADLNTARNTVAKPKTYPPEREVSGEAPRVGVFIDSCGIESGSLDIPALVSYAKTLPNVALAEMGEFLCAPAGPEKMKDIIQKNNLNRVVVAAGSVRNYREQYQDIVQSAGLNKYLLEMANIREQVAWVHKDEPAKATQKAKGLIRMAVADANLRQAISESEIPVTRSGLVIGGGIGGMNAALSLAQQGFPVTLIEKNGELGGVARHLYTTIEGDDVQAYLKDLIAEVKAHPQIEVLTNSEIVDFKGVKGDFTSKVKIGSETREIRHGVAIVASGAQPYKPKEYLYGQHPGVLTQLELGERLATKPEEAKGWKNIAMIQCVGSRNEENPNCSRICCQAAIKNALHIKKLNPEANVFVLYRDMRTYGLMEDFYQEARKQGVLLFRYRRQEPPVVEDKGGRLNIRFKDLILGRELTLSPDILGLSTGAVPGDNDTLAKTMKLERDSLGWFQEVHLKQRPIDFFTEGVYMCGLAHAPKLITETIAQAQAAAGRALTVLSAERQRIGGVVAVVDKDICAACLICVRACPYDVPYICEDGYSVIDPARCQGCGICPAECPAKAITLQSYTDAQLLAKCDALLAEAAG
ncbi:MAG: CoB--CoM heterodisulfide reductase iron-sulfur subunit A family protein [Deltaproteobacteria bacterium]|nr:CoB--CoM heterodisulfide reductase iron-sulfur subunit A family protein [Deltaproteobacteria bacterium]